MASIAVVTDDGVGDDEENRRNDCAIAACVTGVDMRVQVYFDGLNAPIYFSCIFSLTLRIWFDEFLMIIRCREIYHGVHSPNAVIDVNS